MVLLAKFEGFSVGAMVLVGVLLGSAFDGIHGWIVDGAFRSDVVLVSLIVAGVLGLTVVIMDLALFPTMNMVRFITSQAMPVAAIMTVLSTLLVAAASVLSGPSLTWFERLASFVLGLGPAFVAWTWIVSICLLPFEKRRQNHAVVT